jgi:ubiquinone biosynthesis protein COQ4
MSLDLQAPDRIRPIDGLKALLALRHNPQDTEQVFKLTAALAGSRPQELRARFRSDPMGLQRLQERKSLLPALSRTEWLSQLPAGTVGRVYHDFLAEQGLSAQGLVDLSQKVFGTMDDDGSDRYYIGRRLRDMHDIFHVLSGYGRDEIGEVCVLAFSYPHQRTRSFGLIASAGAFTLARRFKHKGIPAAAWQAYQLGKQCQWLLVQNIESLLARDLQEVRRELGIGSPSQYLAVIHDLRQRGQHIPVPPALMGSTPAAHCAH